MAHFERTNRPGRITSLHGVLLPPKKKISAGTSITLRFVIVGTIPSKKNMIWADNNLRQIMPKLRSFVSVKPLLAWLTDNLKSFVRNSGKYKDWEQAQLPVLQAQAQAEKAKYPDVVYPLDQVSVKVYHYWTTDEERDLTNKLDSLNDLFVASGIVVNDNWQVINKISSESENYRGEILEQITTIDLTIRTKVR